MTFQSGLTAIEVDFEEEEEEEDSEPLRMEHFYFPLGALLIGILLSVFCCIMETIFHSLRKSKTNFPLEVLEEPSLPQSTPESEGQRNIDLEDNKV